MSRIIISVEGLSEKIFVEKVLVQHLSDFGVYASVHDMKGNISLDRIGDKLDKLIDNYDYVTTLYDFYGFKKIASNETKLSLETKITNEIKESQRDKIIPYIQMYEFEALLFSDAKKMAAGLNTKQGWIDKVLRKFSDIEKINNSKATAPSKRIQKECQYRKTSQAPEILKNIGLKEIRAKCKGFDAWLTQLENL